MKLRYIPGILLLLFCLPETRSQAQPDDLTLRKGRVMAILDTFSGQFAAARADGRTLLFAGGLGLTSHISVAVDDVIYTNYGKSRMTVPPLQRNLGQGRAEVLDDRLRCTWELPLQGGTLRIIQELEAVSDSLYDEVRVHLVVENATAGPLDVGITVMEDVDADGDDYVPLRHLGERVQRERRFEGTELPERLHMISPAFHPDTAYCRFFGEGLTRPDAVTVGRWSYHGDLGTAVYGYRASGRVIGDVAALLQWDRRSLPSGARREASTAVGFSAPLPVPPRHSSFAREFVIPMVTNGVLLSIVSDTTAQVRLTAPFSDGGYEAKGTWNLSWDTLVTVRPDRPASVFVLLVPIGAYSNKSDYDSLSWYRRTKLLATADADVGIIVRDILGGEVSDARLVWPERWWDSEYLYHGMMSPTASKVNSSGEATTVTWAVTRSFGLQTHTIWTPAYGHTRFRGDAGEVRIALPPWGDITFGSGPTSIFNPWWPQRVWEDDISITAVGIPFWSDRPVAVPFLSWPPWPGWHGRRDAGETTHFINQSLNHPSRTQLGTEYTFVPFRKTGATEQSDLLRIIAYEDGTEVTLFDGTPSLRLDRSDHIDTLVGEATVIRANKPLAVYQHHLFWKFVGTDSTFFGGGLTLLPHGLWGRRYHSVTDDVYQPNVSSMFPRFFRDESLKYHSLYLILITRAEHTAGVRINGIPVAPTRFTTFGEFAYAYIDIAPGYHIVESAHPFVTISCGGGHDERDLRYNYVPGATSFGVSYIPPYR